MKPPTEIDLVWDRDLVFSGRSDQGVIVLDSAGIAGPSPVQSLLFALAGCMGMDVVHVLRKGRHDLRELRIHLVGERAQEDPHRVTAVTIDFAITGAVPDAQVQRAIDLSHQKYCSVWHSLRQDIRLETRFAISPGLP
ncbi:MAG TPA: OsmC family protein [Vicinamibacterales bacterium]|jgi:putative redox protein